MKEILLSRGKVALVDDSDFEFLNQWKWTCSKKGYAHRRPSHNGKRVTVWMHKVLLGHFDGRFEDDHKDRNKLNNQKYNLRVATPAQSGMNRSFQAANRSGYMGVKQSGIRFIARIKVKRKSIYSKSFATPLEAAAEYNRMATKYFGEWACLNEL